MSLTARETDVLITIVEEYIANAAPVGSRTVAKRSGLQLSPASMRNTMADLTDKGFLNQPHTSAGRVPTALAFRLYVDNRLHLAPLSATMRSGISRNLLSSGLELSDVLSQAARMVSDFSRGLSIILAPSRADVRWKSIDFSLIKPRLVLAVLILEGGIVQNKLLEVDEDISAGDLVAFGNYLNDHFAGLTLAQARSRILGELLGAESRLQEMYRKALRLARHAFDNLEDRDLYVEGQVNILEYAEFADIHRMRDILRLVEERSRLLDILDRTILAEEGTKITLGQETDEQGLSEYGVVSSTYGRDSHTPGIVGVIGPLRMDYAKIVPVVDYIANALTNLLKQRF